MGKETPTHQRTLLASIFCILVKIEFSHIQDAWGVLHAESISLILSAIFVYRKWVTNCPTGVVNEISAFEFYMFLPDFVHNYMENYRIIREWTSLTLGSDWPRPQLLWSSSCIQAKALCPVGLLSASEEGAWQRYWRACSYAVKYSLRGNLAWGIPAMAWLHSPQTLMAICDTST